MLLNKILHPRTDYSVAKKLVVLPATVAFYTCGYMYLNMTTIHSPKFYNVALPFEKDIPFFPELIWSYIFVYFLVIILFLSLNNDDLLLETVRSFVTCSLIHFAFFYFFPVKMLDRPVLLPNGGFWHDSAAFWYWLDEPTTLFPSAHVSMSFLSAYYTRRVHRRLGDFCLLMAAYVGVSVVLIKQHYIPDVIAGFVLASLVYRFYARRAHKKEEEGALLSAA